MEELIKLVSEYGILVIIAGVFIWLYVAKINKMDDVLRDVQQKVVAQDKVQDRLDSLAHIEVVITENRQLLVDHDKRAEEIGATLKAVQATMNAGGKSNDV